jgi:hypothetical protein
MTPKDSPPEDKATKKEPETDAAVEQEPHKSRRHGYRGYPNNPDIGGSVHFGTGFAGVGPTGGAGSSEEGLISEKTRESVDELGQEEEEEKK